MSFYSKFSSSVKDIIDSRDRSYKQPDGVDFGGTIEVEDMGLDKTRGFKYQGANEYICDLLDKLEITESDAMLDIGCGKGKAMYFFTRNKFSKIGGYDLFEELVDIANKNFKILGIEDKCTAIVADASEYDDYDDYTFFYLYNPVPKPIFEIVLDRINKSYERNPRKITMLYENSLHTEYIESHSALKEKFIFRTGMNRLINWTPLKLYCY